MAKYQLIYQIDGGKWVDFGEYEGPDDDDNRWAAFPLECFTNVSTMTPVINDKAPLPHHPDAGEPSPDSRDS